MKNNLGIGQIFIQASDICKSAFHLWISILVKVFVAFLNCSRKWKFGVNDAAFVFGVQPVCELQDPALQLHLDSRLAK